MTKKTNTTKKTSTKNLIKTISTFLNNCAKSNSVKMTQDEKKFMIENKEIFERFCDELHYIGCEDTAIRHVTDAVNEFLYKSFIGQTFGFLDENFEIIEKVIHICCFVNPNKSQISSICKVSQLYYTDDKMRKNDVKNRIEALNKFYSMTPSERFEYLIKA